MHSTSFFVFRSHNHFQSLRYRTQTYLELDKISVSHNFCSIPLQFPFFLVLNLLAPQWVIIAAFSTVTGIDFLITWGMCYYLWKIRVAVSRFFFFWFPILYLPTDITLG